MPPARARHRLRRRQGGGRHDGQARMNEAIFLFALSVPAALVQLSSPNVLAGHHSKSKANDIFIFSVLASFCTAIISMTLPRRKRPRIVRASSRLAAFSAAVAFSSVTSMVLPRTVWWAAYVACAFPLFNLFPRPFVLCFEFLKSGFCSLKQIIALCFEFLKSGFCLLKQIIALCFEFLKSGFCSLKQIIEDLCQTQNRGVEIIAEV